MGKVFPLLLTLTATQCKPLPQVDVCHQLELGLCVGISLGTYVGKTPNLKSQHPPYGI